MSANKQTTDPDPNKSAPSRTVETSLSGSHSEQDLTRVSPTKSTGIEQPGMANTSLSLEGRHSLDAGLNKVGKELPPQLKKMPTTCDLTIDMFLESDLSKQDFTVEQKKQWMSAFRLFEHGEGNGASQSETSATDELESEVISEDIETLCKELVCMPDDFENESEEYEILDDFETELEHQRTNISQSSSEVTVEYIREENRKKYRLGQFKKDAKERFFKFTPKNRFLLNMIKRILRYIRNLKKKKFGKDKEITVATSEFRRTVYRASEYFKHNHLDEDKLVGVIRKDIWDKKGEFGCFTIDPNAVAEEPPIDYEDLEYKLKGRTNLVSNQLYMLMENNEDEQLYRNKVEKYISLVESSRKKTEYTIHDASTKTEDTIPDDSTKMGDTIPNDSTKMGDTIPNDSTKTQDTVPDDSTKTQDTVPDDSTKTQDIVPDDSTKTQDTVPDMSTKKEDTIPDANNATLVGKEDNLELESTGIKTEKEQSVRADEQKKSEEITAADSTLAQTEESAQRKQKRDLSPSSAKNPSKKLSL